MESNELLILRAIDFAARKHRDQRRKDEEASPYINHPIPVSLLLAEIGGISDPQVLSAAILHDTIEDTDTTPEELEGAVWYSDSQSCSEYWHGRSFG